MTSNYNLKWVTKSTIFRVASASKNRLKFSSYFYDWCKYMTELLYLFRVILVYMDCRLTVDKFHRIISFWNTGDRKEGKYWASMIVKVSNIEWQDWRPNVMLLDLNSIIIVSNYIYIYIHILYSIHIESFNVSYVL